MESLMEWFANNGEALWATVISFFSAYGVALVSLVIGIIKTKLSAIAQAKASDAKMVELCNRLNKRIDELEANVIENSNVNTEKRLSAMQAIADSVVEANNNVQPAEPIINDADEALNNLD